MVYARFSGNARRNAALSDSVGGGACRFTRGLPACGMMSSGEIMSLTFVWFTLWIFA